MRQIAAHLFSRFYLNVCMCMYVCSAAEVIYANVDVDANIIFGALVDDKVTSGEVSMSFIGSYIHRCYIYMH